MADAQVARRFRLALEMYEFGERAQRSRLRRTFPDVPDEEIEARVRVWRLSGPIASLGDAVGRPSHRFD